MERFAASWSGGKDSALAFYRARLAGLEVSRLLTIFDDQGLTRSHRIPRLIIKKQAEAIGLPFVEGVASWETYEDEFKRILGELRKEGFTGCVFGDIDLPEHLAWCQRVCSEVGLSAVHPLWGERQEDLVEEFVRLGFQAVIVVVRLEKLGVEFLGRVLDESLLQEFKDMEISPGGELGEYHTLVVAGPVFQNPVIDDYSSLSALRRIVHQGYGFLDLASLNLR
ncbi:MAG: Putative ATP binding protein [Thermoanaerobacterales bacterium 50_218]|nr:MAG: Putative ATP binding protein [Thermoanaerobacterales bacterium 50_218]